jgi:dihydropteroate synthase
VARWPRPSGAACRALTCSGRGQGEGDGSLLEPLGLIHGAAAGSAVAAGRARWLAGGPLAFALVRAGDAILAVGDLPGSTDLDRLSAPLPPWAGLPACCPAVMGILNVTDDSFSDGGLHLDPDRAISAGRAMAAAGAAILDVGGESTRPGAAPTPPGQEQARILPVIRALAADGHLVSVDTRNAATMAAALDAGARIVNDVSGLRHDPAAAPLLAARGCPVVLMHMRGTPATMQTLTGYDDVAREVAGELAERLAAARAAGIAAENIALDPGIGFAKGPGQNEALLARLPLLLTLVGRLTGEARPAGRLAGSLAAGVVALLGGATVLRVHDVPATLQAVRVVAAIAGTTRLG